MKRIYGFMNHVEYIRNIDFSKWYIEAVENKNIHHKLELRNK